MVEHLFVVQAVAGSNPVDHPKYGVRGPSGRRNLPVKQNEIISNNVGSNPIVHPIFSGSIPDTWVTLYTGDIGYTFEFTTFGPKGFSSGSNFLESSSKYPKS